MTCQLTTNRIRLNALLQEGLDIAILKQHDSLFLIEITLHDGDVMKLFYAGANYAVNCMVEHNGELVWRVPSTSKSEQ